MWFKHGIDIQTSNELVPMDINKMMIQEIFTMNDKLTQLENDHTCNRIDYLDNECTRPVKPLRIFYIS